MTRFCLKTLNHLVSWLQILNLSHTQSTPRKDKNIPWKLKMAQCIGETALLSNLTKLLESQSLLHWNKALEKQKPQVLLQQYPSLTQVQVQQTQETDQPVLRNCLEDLDFVLDKWTDLFGLSRILTERYFVKVLQFAVQTISLKVFGILVIWY